MCGVWTDGRTCSFVFGRGGEEGRAGAGAGAGACCREVDDAHLVGLVMGSGLALGLVRWGFVLFCLPRCSWVVGLLMCSVWRMGYTMESG